MNAVKSYKKIVVMGAAESGLGAALLAKQKGHEVFVSNDKPIAIIQKNELQKNEIPYEEGHNMTNILQADLMIKSPGIAKENLFVAAFYNVRKPIMSEIDFAYCYKGDSKIIAITGTNGKSTTTDLIYHIFKTAKEEVALVGNIGYSFAKQIAEKPHKYYVLEVSSFQLDNIHFLKPDIAILLNITPDHLERYDYDFNKYIKAKFFINQFQNDSDVMILNSDDNIIQQHLKTYSTNAQIIQFSMTQKLPLGAYLDKDQYGVINVNNEQTFDADFNSLPLKGRHNKANMLVAGLAAKVMNIKNEYVREALQTYKGLEHRMEKVAVVRGVEYINDSKATNLNSTWYALESIHHPTVLILGGQEKGDGNDYSYIKNLVIEKVKSIICLGKDNERIVNYFKNILPVYDLHSIEDVVKKTYEISTDGDVVLLSPACASFDLFKNFEDRGRQFKKLVNAL